MYENHYRTDIKEIESMTILPNNIDIVYLDGRKDRRCQNLNLCPSVITAISNTFAKDILYYAKRHKDTANLTADEIYRTDHPKE